MWIRGCDFLEDMIDDCQEIVQIVGLVDGVESLVDRNLHKVVIYTLLHLGGFMESFSEEERSLRSAIPWERIIGFKRIVLHGRQNLDMNMVWELSNSCIPDLLSQLKEVRRKEVRLGWLSYRPVDLDLLSLFKDVTKKDVTKKAVTKKDE